MRRPVLYYCDHIEIPLPDGHRFPRRKYRLLRDRLAATGDFAFLPAPLAPLPAILRVHDERYVRAFLDGTLTPAEMRRIGFPWSEGLVGRTLSSVGCTLGSTAQAIETGWGGGLAGGTHHAFRAEGSGYCIFNDIAIAIEDLRARRRIRRAAVIDLDVHQGDGTAAIFEHDPDVLTISLHGRNNFPFRKQRSKIDVEFDDGTGDETYLACLADVLPEVERFTPEIVFYQAGVDALAADRLGKLSLTHEGLERRDAMVFQLCAGRFPLVITLGGGYSEPIDATVESGYRLFVGAYRHFASGLPHVA